MDSGHRQQLQDIYSTGQAERDDYTPQVSSEIVEERHREARRHRLTTFFLGSTVLFVAVGLAYVVIRNYVGVRSDAKTPPPLPQEYIPRYSLPADAQWTLDFPKEFGNPEWDGKGERPFSSMWLQKAAFDLVMAEHAINLQKYDRAAEYYEYALEIFPELEGVKVPLGMAYFKLGEFDKALALLEGAGEDELTPEVLNNLGVSCIHAEAYDRAEKYLKKAISERPAYAEAQKNLAKLYAEEEKTDAAVLAYERYVDLQPTDVDTRHEFALFLIKSARWERAAEVLDRLIQDVTDVPILYQLQAQVESRLDHPEKALKAFKRYAELTDPNAALACMDQKEFDRLRASPEFRSMVESMKRKSPAKP